MASSTPTLWATASKEWVIQPKPKPGRKPKKDPAPTTTTTNVADDEQAVDGKGRRVQNRAAQRAFRERKQSQLADLQARVQSYEQGEIERNVALQSIAKRLKEENETLRHENAILKEQLAKAEQERDAARDSRKRWRDDSPASSIASKRYKVDHDSFTQPYTSSPQSMVSSPDSSDTRFSSVPYDPQPDAFAAFSNLKSESVVFPQFECGFCSSDTPCVCRDVFHNVHEPKQLSVTPIRSIVLGTPPPQDEPSILDNLPPYQPPVPLRLRPRGPTTQINTIFQVSPPTQPSSAQPMCSGDPSNCPACADDSFGKAFCEKLSALPPCDNCPDAPDGVTDASNETIVLQHPHSPLAIPAPSHPSGSSSFVRPDAPTETIPTNDAWRRIKAHPNVSFADLDMLADVVARRTKCKGPRVTISPPPVSEPVAAGTSSERPVLLTDPHAHFREQEAARASATPPQLQCGQRLLREVPADAVREALRLLDSKFLPQ